MLCLEHLSQAAGEMAALGFPGAMGGGGGGGRQGGQVRGVGGGGGVGKKGGR